MENSIDASELNNLPAHQREAVETLLKAQNQGLRVSITEGGVTGEAVGRVSDVRLVNDRLVFKVEGETYKPFYDISVEVLGIHTEVADPSEILQNVAAHEREAVETLLKAQAEGLRVSIIEGGVAGETVGRVSDVRLVNDKIVFKVEDKDYEPFYGISVKVLGQNIESFI